MGTREYDRKLAAIQAKRLYQKMLKMYEYPMDDHTRILLQDLRSSFDFFCDIIHLMDDEDDIKLINIDRAKPGKEG